MGDVLQIKEFERIIFDDVVIYKMQGEEFEDLYKGSISKMPNNIKDMTVVSIGAKRKGILDIRVRN